MVVNARPMINSADIERNGYVWAMADTLDLPEVGEPAIVNTDIKGGQGVHWLCIARTRGDKCFIYDPLGASNVRGASTGEKTDTALWRSLIESGIDPNGVEIYRHKSQKSGNSLCGWHSLYVASIIKKNLARHPNASPQDLGALVAHKLDKRASEHNIEVLHRAFGRP